MQKLQNIVMILQLGDAIWFLLYFRCVFSRWFSGIKCLVKHNYLDHVIQISKEAWYDMSVKHCMPISKIWPSHKAVHCSNTRGTNWQTQLWVSSEMGEPHTYEWCCGFLVPWLLYGNDMAFICLLTTISVWSSFLIISIYSRFQTYGTHCTIFSYS